MAYSASRVAIDYSIVADYNELRQKEVFQGALHCNTAFIAADSSVRAGHAVFFDITGNTEAVTGYHWDVNRASGWGFGPGNDAADRAPAIYFTEAGTYDVELTVTTAIGREITDTHAVTVLPNRPPEADAGRDATTSTNRYQLNGLDSEDPDGDRLNFAWTKPSGVSWESGSNSAQARPVARFTDFGPHTFQLQVCALGGCDIDEVTISYWPFE